jgi:SAM-dependent methyltransferase
VIFGELERRLGRRLARLTTKAVVEHPPFWRAFRFLTRKQFDRLAPAWAAMRSPEAFAALEQALDAVPGSPRRVLDLGTGTGMAAFIVARRFQEAEVVGVDLAERMVEEARSATPPELAGRVHFEHDDAEHLPYPDGSFELVTLANMIPFFDELARLVAPGGHLVFSFSAGPETPIWVPSERLRSELGRRGFSDFADFEAGGGTALLARRLDRI